MSAGRRNSPGQRHSGSPHRAGGWIRSERVAAKATRNMGRQATAHRRV